MRPAWLLLVLLLAALVPRLAQAHPLAPLGLTVEEGPGGEVHAELRRSRVQPRGARFHLRLPEHCRALAAPVVRVEERAVIEQHEWRCAASLEGTALSVDGLTESGVDAVVRVELASGVVHRALLSPQRPSLVIPTVTSPLSVAASYLRLGVDHLLGGLDHLLFVLGMTLLVRRRRRLLMALTAFTVGHSITLCVSTLGLLTMPSGLVEVAIAASLVWLGLQIVQGEASEERQRWLWPAAALFGLLHGLGFASALAQTGLPPTDIPLALASFNVGVELGQLWVVACALVVAYPLRRWLPDTPALRQRLPGYALGGIAAMWCIERGLVALGAGGPWG